MNEFFSISGKRWFMGKGKSISRISEKDSVEIGNTRLRLLLVEFDDQTSDTYTFIDNENSIGSLFVEAFSEGATHSVFPAQKGYFVFKSYVNIQAKYLRSLHPVNAEQSNSAFISPGKLFFKLYRRLEAGIHPEAEILEQLSQKNFEAAPAIYGSITYKSESGESYTLGILEELVQGMSDAWEKFNTDMNSEQAYVLGIKTAQMHKAFQGLDGYQTDEKFSDTVPLKKLEDLLFSARKSNDEALRNLSQEVIDKLPLLKNKIQSLEESNFFPSKTSPLQKRQRIHGDYHLGQILIGETPSQIKILDFEGEPTRSLAYRRILRSPAVDIAGMLRSFRYASACSGIDSQNCERAFLEGYAQYTDIDAAELEKNIAPYILAKAVYEACYELEFRPNWFHIPAKALTNA